MSDAYWPKYALGFCRCRQKKRTWQQRQPSARSIKSWRVGIQAQSGWCCGWTPPPRPCCWSTKHCKLQKTSSLVILHAPFPGFQHYQDSLVKNLLPQTDHGPALRFGDECEMCRSWQFLVSQSVIFYWTPKLFHQWKLTKLQMFATNKLSWPPKSHWFHGDSWSIPLGKTNGRFRWVWISCWKTSTTKIPRALRLHKFQGTPEGWLGVLGFSQRFWLVYVCILCIYSIVYWAMHGLVKRRNFKKSKVGRELSKWSATASQSTLSTSTFECIQSPQCCFMSSA